MPAGELHHLRPVARAGARAPRPAGGDRRGAKLAGGRPGGRRGTGRGAPCALGPALLGVAGDAQDEEPGREVPRRPGTGVHGGRGAALPAGAVHRRAARDHGPGDDRGHAGPVRGARDAGGLHRPGVRLPEERALSRQRRSAPPGRAAVGGCLVERQWAVARRFGAGVGFHSGSGKSAQNYRVMGEVTGGRLEIKTSGRYTYEMGAALSRSRDPTDQALWRDWYRFTAEMALAGAFSGDATERRMARSFISSSLGGAGRDAGVFESPGRCRAAVEALSPSPDHMIFFEYNFLFVLAAGGRADKAA